MGTISRKIKINIGTSDTLVRETLKFMIEMGLIKETSHMVFKIMSAELEDELKTNPRTRTRRPQGLGKKNERNT